MQPEEMPGMRSGLVSRAEDEGAWELASAGVEVGLVRSTWIASCCPAPGSSGASLRISRHVACRLPTINWLGLSPLGYASGSESFAMRAKSERICLRSRALFCCRSGVLLASAGACSGGGSSVVENIQHSVSGARDRSVYAAAKEAGLSVRGIPGGKVARTRASGDWKWI